MGLVFETRASDSPWISTVWTSRSDEVSQMTSVASETWGLVFWRQGDAAHAAVVGPESGTSAAAVPEGAEFLGIQFAVGTSLRATPTSALVDAGLELPDTTARRFWLQGDRLEVPGMDDAEALVDRLVRRELIGRDPVVATILSGRETPGSDRTAERRFRAATGFTRGAVQRIARAREAAGRLLAGDEVADVVVALGYYDEPHLARALRRYVGRTAGQLRNGTGGALALSAQRTTS